MNYMNNKTVIGLEIHVQLKTKSKMFCRCDNNAEGAAPNTLVCPICLGMPGTLPVANKTAIEWTLKTGLALNCKIADFSRFDRKHYFYPDLPKGYQISQYDKPFCTDGFLEIPSEQDKDGLSWIYKKIGLQRVHLEEDAGKLIHSNGSSLVDLNRAGTPLMEIVTKPEIESPAEAKLFLRMLRSTLRYLGVSDADMDKGHLRCDANISIEVDGKEGVPAEIKNINSFRMLERALSHEEKRQKEALSRGEKITKETRGWDDVKGITYSQRSKEQAQDYRYFPEPDIPPFTNGFFRIEEIGKNIPELPGEKLRRYIDWKKGDKIPLIDVGFLLVEEEKTSDYYEAVKSSELIHPVSAANWIVNILKVENIDKIDAKKLSKIIKFVEKHVISGTKGKEIMQKVIDSGSDPDEIIEKEGFRTISSEEELEKIIKDVIKKNEKSVADYRKGKKEALGFLVGQVMRETKGQADPQIANKLLIINLEKD
jgi:aspartyl-tRNA(Asn)/glutamyl-tRNA(Gln) amidotransferase subunit B